VNDKTNFDVIIIGGGIAGSALAGNLARSGLSVLLLERETKFTDRVRGEWMAPWGVAETKKLHLYDKLMAAGGNHITKAVNYDELLTPEQALANSMPLDSMHPDAPGPLCIEHVSIQEIAMQFALDSGALVKCGVKKIVANAGATPRVEYSDGGTQFTKTCRLIVGADGRSSTVRRQLGLQLDEREIDHLISGLLIDGAEGWPSDVQSLGKAGDVMYLVFPQGGGKIRLYVDYALADRGKYSGEQGARNLLKAFDTPVLPDGHYIANARPIGPCQAFPSQDASLDDPYVAGAILIGDAAGYTDPIFGQGMSIALRDARIVRDLLLGNDDWSVSTFAAYGLERNERMRRIMRMTHFATTLFARFDPQSIENRARAMQRMAEDPKLGAIVACAFTGPEVIPAECFTDDYYDRVFAP
jgi:2-polyprenyl-6-methoxyphenol hydroxylase-like FAD-dependent oxidoreductase